ncbi:hypothetical protein [Pontivivens nitratireducens]|uniref:Uncharacterized protein n=1 Tax=Pontivivens nitratireducens TaxID=2758038 RepID=A0A6G7VHI3_9RHOB|nr:hypothetical protein [Pontibrevibacter nitratireducens]QIK39509.1 hypothetical protein G8E03_01275 [Pontibrevibacter nitratireducens]
MAYARAGVGTALTRLVTSLSRAFLVLVFIALPAFLLPETSRTGQEISLIIGALFALFTMFEYASSHPGLIDFRFAPPYNRFRFLTFAVLIVALVFLCRADSGADSFSDDYLALSDRLVEIFSVPFSPVVLADTLIGAGVNPLVERAAALSFTIALTSIIFFAIYVWVFRWPAERDSFNLWINLPTFDPSVGQDIAWRLRRAGLLNIIVALALPYAVLSIASRSGGWFDPAALGNYQSLVWCCVFWAFFPVALFNRGSAMLKIAWLIDRARTD